MKLNFNPPSAEPKSKQCHFRMTVAQERALRQHCIRCGLSTTDAILAALVATVPGFPV